MCGIAGYIGTRAIDPHAVRSCLALMGRRGPDHRADRHWRTPDGRNVYLLHSRLSIIDLDPRSNQPYGVDRRWIALNGELYNYLERREDLARRGEAFATTSDTEVLLRSIARDGWLALDACEGMWAFAVYDEASGVLSLCRDRFGEKPLYLHRDATGLYFGSEPKLVMALAGRRLRPNRRHLQRYLVNGYKSLYKGTETFFEELAELPAAHVLHLGPGGERLERYWTPRLGEDESLSYEDAVAGARERLIRSVELRLRADVPLAFCMSGGVDSNSLISIAKRELGYDVHGFTIMNTDARYEERDMIELAVRELGIRHTPIPLSTEGFLPRLRELVRYHDAPVATITYYAHWLLQESIARHGYRISVSGTAADELFSGYFDHHLLYLADIGSLAAEHAGARDAWETHIRPIVRNPLLRDADVFVKNRSFRDHIYFDAEGFGRYLMSPEREAFREEDYVDGLLRNRMLNETFHETVPVILHEDDANAMYYSIENRSPFLDRPLFEFCQSIPVRHLVRSARAKAVLRDAMRGIVPQPVLDNRRKVGFNAPIEDLLNLSDGDVRRTVLADSPVFEIIRRERVAELCDKHKLPNSESKFLFYFLNTKLFLEELAA
jgi:asparagine synthase (glutamine-hydrolysing)